jgi:uncharacterized RDD family membrane protein YckC
MNCPQCQSSEIDPSGVCSVCGCQLIVSPSVKESESTDKENKALSGVIEIDYAEGSEETPADNEEMPGWRKELSQRLQEIKQRKEAAEAQRKQTESKTPPSSASRSGNAMPSSILPPKLFEKPLRQKAPSKIPTLIPRQKVLQPLAEKPETKGADPKEVKELIDQMVSRQSASESNPVPFAEGPGFMAERYANYEGKLILLSRTLSGLVDLICIVFCTGAFIIAADLFSGIVILDAISILDFLLLFLLMYFVYSIFFLATSNQTIGMMITDLRIVSANEGRPSLRQIFSRCCGHLISLFGLGIGLLWSLFNRENLCFHDRLSGTHVVRI